MCLIGEIILSYWPIHYVPHHIKWLPMVSMVRMWALYSQSQDSRILCKISVRNHTMPCARMHLCGTRKHISICICHGYKACLKQQYVPVLDLTDTISLWYYPKTLSIRSLVFPSFFYNSLRLYLHINTLKSIKNEE